jgi:hypothetical protein
VSCRGDSHKSAFGGRAFVPPDITQQPAETDEPAPRSLAVAEAIEEVAAFEPPDGIDAAVFEELKARLVEELGMRGSERLVSAPPTSSAARVDDLVISHSVEMGYYLVWTYKNTGDYDMSGEVGVPDITPIAMRYLASTTDGDQDELDAWIDGDGDGTVGISDITPIANNYLATVTGYEVMARDFDSSTVEVVSTAPFQSGFSDEENPVIRFRLGLPTDVINRILYVRPAGATDTEALSNIAASDIPGLVTAQNLKVLDPMQGATLDAVDASSMTVTFAGEVPQIAAGDIVSMPVGAGYLRLVDSVQQNGNTLTLTTTDATLGDVVQTGTIERSISMYGGIIEDMRSPSQGGKGSSRTVSSLGEVEFDLGGTVLYDDGDLKVELSNGLV